MLCLRSDFSFVIWMRDRAHFNFLEEPSVPNVPDFDIQDSTTLSGICFPFLSSGHPTYRDQSPTRIRLLIPPIGGALTPRERVFTVLKRVRCADLHPRKLFFPWPCLALHFPFSGCRPANARFLLFLPLHLVLPLRTTPPRTSHFRTTCL